MNFRRLTVLFLTSALAATPLVFVPLHSAHAQMTEDEQEAQQEAEEAHKRAEARKDARRAAPPSALPGADSSEEEAGHANLELSPTNALFDAINRGSLNAAKEALNRGADMRARNILDQTPLDMSIDLNRNDITFLLLSMRTYNPDGKLDASTSHGDIDTDENGNGHISINGTGKKGAPKGPVWDTHGGTPIPSIGFLGFAGK